MLLIQLIALLQVICTKVRDGDKRIVRLKEGQARGRHVVIVDDLVQSGGTLMECQKLLKSQVSLHSCTKRNGSATRFQAKCMLVSSISLLYSPFVLSAPLVGQRNSNKMASESAQIVLCIPQTADGEFLSDPR